MNKTKLGILEDMLIKKEKIKSEDSSLRVENTAEGLQASITCIESNKIEQETREGYNLVNEKTLAIKSPNYDNMEKIEDEVYTTKVASGFGNFRPRFDTVEFEANETYYLSADIKLLLGQPGGVMSTINIMNTDSSNIANKQTLTDIIPNFNEYQRLIVKLDVGDTSFVSDGLIIQQNRDSVDTQLLIKNVQISKINAPYEKYGQSPSTEFQSPVEGVTGDLKLKVQNKNLAYDIIYSNPKVQYYPFARLKYKLTEGRYYIISYDTENNGFFSYINSGSYYGLRKITDLYSQEHDGSKKKWIVQAIKSNLYEVNLINRLDATSEIGAGRIYNLMIEEIDATTDKEALNYLPSKYVEHKEQEFTISLGNKAFYKGDKIVRQNGKWYFVHNEYNKYIMDGITHKFEIKTSSVNNNQYYSNNINNIKVASDNSEILDIYSNMFLKNSANELYTGRTQQGISIQIDGKIAVGLGLDSGIDTVEKANTWLQTNNLEVVYPLETSELELIEDENLIKQLDAILLYISEYKDLTNFDFDNDVIFEITVEKDNLKIINSRLDELEKQSITTSALALESEV